MVPPHLSRRRTQGNRRARRAGHGTVDRVSAASDRLSTPPGVRLRPRAGFTLLEIAMVLVTLTTLVAVSIGASTSEGFRGAMRSTSATATQEALVTVLSRAAAEAIEQKGVYRPTGLRQGAIGLQVNGLPLTFDCSGGTQLQEGQVPECPAITIGGVAQVAANPGARGEGELIAHLTTEQTRAIVVSMTSSGRCAVVVGDVEEIVARYVTDAADGVCLIPLRHLE
jgi:hypothetical protein